MRRNCPSDLPLSPYIPGDVSQVIMEWRMASNLPCVIKPLNLAISILIFSAGVGEKPADSMGNLVVMLSSRIPTGLPVAAASLL